MHATSPDLERRTMQVQNHSRWNFVVEDFDAANFATGGAGADVDVVIVSMKPEVCCGLTGQTAG